MTPLVKICGLSTPETLEAALEAGADMVGFVHFPRSPRHVTLDLGGLLSREARGRAERVLLLVDPDDAAFDDAVEAIDPDLVQLHGRESPDRVAELRRRGGRPVMKALGIGDAADLAAIALYARAADRILLDAKPPAGATLPGGNGEAFDWRLLAGLAPGAPRDDGSLDPGPPLMLSGGLTPDNVAAALAVTGLTAVDVSSGVETRPGVKDPERIARFVRAARLALRDDPPGHPLPGPGNEREGQEP